MRNEGQRTSWTKVKKRAKLFLTGKLKELQQTSYKFYRKQQQLLPDAYSTQLNQELDASEFDWEAMHKEMKEKRISMTNKQVN